MSDCDPRYEHQGCRASLQRRGISVMRKRKAVPCVHCGGESRAGRCWGCYLLSTGKRALGGSFDHLVYEVNPDTGCWVWTGPTIGLGYGYMKDHEKAHRFSYRTQVGPIPDGLFVLHRCDNPPCVNPVHLFLGTNADNMADKKTKGRAARGAGNSNARLTEKQVLEIRSSSEPSSVQAQKYGVHVTHINRIKRGAKWAHLLETAA